ncbi:MAG: hypothetical protein HQ556_08470 [Candidatus Marinimicrobia bacterium]|nr:hypothetical protein [Candidatus Neomarinimicrobiota bacterium]
MLERKSEVIDRMVETDYRKKYGTYANREYEQDWINVVYVPAAYSHLVATALSTFIESMLSHEFHNLSLNPNYKTPLNDHVRWKLETSDFWNPKRVSTSNGKPNKKYNLVKGSIQLLEALEIENKIIPTVWDAVECLFEYRNVVVHGGFEWKNSTIEKFSKLIKSRGWKKNFEEATSNKKVWIYYLSESTIESILSNCQSMYQLFDMELKNGLNEFYGKK